MVKKFFYKLKNLQHFSYNIIIKVIYTEGFSGENEFIDKNDLLLHTSTRKNNPRIRADY